MPKKPKSAVEVVSPEALRVTVRPDPKPDTPFYYVNFAAVGHTEYDFTLSVLRIPSQLTSEQTALAKQGKPVPIEPLLQILLPPRS